MKQSVVRPIHHQQKAVVWAQRHQPFQAAEGESTDSLHLAGHQQPTVQGNASHVLKGTDRAHYLRGCSRLNP
jgi:hypothetical protein